MWTDSEVWRFSAAVVLALLAAALVRDHSRDRSAWTSVAFISCVVGHLLSPLLLRAGAPSLLSHPVLLLGIAAPFAFWLLAQVHFADDFRLGPVHAVMLLALLGAGYLSWLVTAGGVLTAGPFAPAYHRFWSLLPRILSLAIVIHALLRVYVGAGSDLVLPRLKARYLLLVVAGTYIVVELLGEALIIGTAAEQLADRVHSMAVLIVVWAVALLSLRAAPDVLRPARQAPDEPALDPALAERLRQLIEVGEVFQEEGLTIGSLAERLGAQEYKLRQLINAQLGFKNFNAFLNRFRVAAAEKVLADPGKAHLGVAEVAYQVGYRSLGTFNRAFRELTGRTPSDYRTSRKP
jgi:AraC-like DNA-binding protein